MFFKFDVLLLFCRLHHYTIIASAEKSRIYCVYFVIVASMLGDSSGSVFQ